MILHQLVQVLFFAAYKKMTVGGDLGFLSQADHQTKNMNFCQTVRASAKMPFMTFMQVDILHRMA